MNASYRSFCALAASLLIATASNAATIAYWDFEDGADGQEFTAPPTPNGEGGSVDTVNGILMRGFNDAFGPSWTSNTADGSGLAMNLEINSGVSVTSDGYVTEGALHNWSPTAWTIETHVLLRNLGGWNTLIGRDGSSQAEPESDFYLANNGIDDRFRINIDTVGGMRWILDADPPSGPAQADTWYGLAAVSDGQTLSLWIDEGTGYQQAASLDISAQSVADNALPGTTLNWTFGRGWFNGGFVDHIDGVMDNVRFSDVALGPNELIPLIPEPTTASLALVTICCALRRRV